MEGFGVEAARTNVEFEPSVWGDYFITNPQLPSSMCKESKEWMKERVERLKEEVKMILRDGASPLAKLHIIDSLQRLGIEYHFEKEIDQELHQIYENPVASNDLHTNSLQFRLLRQHFYNVPSDVFKMFKDGQGNFKLSLVEDIKGLLSLYDAAYLAKPNEHILDEGIEFARRHLKLKLADPILATKVEHSLKTPLHRRMRRLEARLYIPMYEAAEENCNEAILELAKLDFHLLQLIHQAEIRAICMWWKELGLSSKLTFARDRIVEGYFWILGVYFEPQHSRARMTTTKVIALLSLADDIFDNSGGIFELKKYNEVIQRWDPDNVSQLPEYFQLHFHALDDIIKGFENELAHEGMSYRVHLLKDEIKKAIGAWFEQAVVADEGRLLPLDEYLPISLKCTAYQTLVYASYVGMGEIATKDVIEWVANYPKLVEATSKICRFKDDVVDDELKTKGFGIITTVTCYANDHGISIEAACEKLLIMVEDAWKVLNEECMGLSKTLPMPIITQILNWARMMETIYTDIDGYTHPSTLKNYITLLLIEPILF